MQKNNGFSLIEISVVLILMGIIMMGIIGGASLIKNATIRSLMYEVNAYNAAVSVYRARFNYLPGDINGNRNGRIEYFNQDSLNPVYEGMQLWADVVNRGIIAKGFSVVDGSVDNSPAVIGDNIPVSRLSSAGWVGDFRDNENMIMLANPTGIINDGASVTDTMLESDAVIIAEDALDIDSKMDDGNKDTGSVRSYSGNGETCSYSSASSSFECFMGFTTPL